jgi:hypothetical protein
MDKRKHNTNLFGATEETNEATIRICEAVCNGDELVLSNNQPYLFNCILSLNCISDRGLMTGWIYFRYILYERAGNHLMGKNRISAIILYEEVAGD